MKKSIICLLVLAMLVSLFACSSPAEKFVYTDDDEDKSVERPDDTSEVVSNESEDDPNSYTSVEPETKPENNGFSMTTPVKDFEGKEIRIINGSMGMMPSVYSGEVIYSEEEPTRMDEAKRRIVQRVEELYNVKIVGVEQTHNVSSEIISQVLAGNEDYHIAFDFATTAYRLATSRVLKDLNEIDTIDFTASWWDQNVVNDMSVGGQLYCASGDINTFDDFTTSCVLFNKNVKDKYIPDIDLYALARRGTWTYDKLHEICTSNGITHDSNRDGVLDEKDTWALGTETYSVLAHFRSSGEKIVKKNADDIPYLTLSKESTRTYSILSEILDFYNDANTVMVANKYTDKFPTDCWGETTVKAFIEERELFYAGNFITATDFRSKGVDFGILPVPKWDITQDRYYSNASGVYSIVMFIPDSFRDDDVEDIGLIVSAIAELSEYSLTPAVYDTILKYGNKRDDESADMLDIIFASRSLDLGEVFWLRVLDQYASLDGDVVSRLDSAISSSESDLEDIVDDLIY